MYCPKCGYEYQEGVKVCSDCGTELIEKEEKVKSKTVKSNFKDDNIKLINLRIENWLKCGGLGFAFFGILFIFPKYFMTKTSFQVPLFFRIFQTLSVTFSIIMRGIFYYGIGVIIELLKENMKTDD